MTTIETKISIISTSEKKLDNIFFISCFHCRWPLTMWSLLPLPRIKSGQNWREMPSKTAIPCTLFWSTDFNNWSWMTCHSRDRNFLATVGCLISCVFLFAILLPTYSLFGLHYLQWLDHIDKMVLYALWTWKI